MAGEGMMPRSAKYEYRPAANLVLESDRDRRLAREPTGEVESLVGKLEGTRMGDRVARARPQELDDRLEKARRKRDRAAADADADAFMPRKRERAAAERGFLSELERVEGLTYRPRTRETRDTYGAILAMVRRQLGDHPQDILAGAAEEVLATMKNDEMREPVKKSKVSELLGPLTDDAFTRLTNLSKAITDWGTTDASTADGPSGAAGAAARATLDADAGVAVILDEEEEEEEEDLDEVRDVDEEDALVEAEGEDTTAGDGLTASATAGETAAAAAARAEADEVAQGLVPVHEIDAYWLQRALHAHYADADVSQRMADEVLSILGTAFGSRKSADLRVVENRLVELLDYDKFDLIKRILKNAARIYYVTRLRQAQSDADRDAVRAELAADDAAGGARILAALDKVLSSESWVADRTQSMTERVRQEAARLAGAAAARAGVTAAVADEAEAVVSPTGKAGTRSAAPASLPPVLLAAGLGGPGAPAGTRGTRVLDLESLAFSNAGHTMTNKRVELPPKSWRAQKKGYEEVHIPALKARPFSEDEREIPIAELPDWSQAAFAKMTKLNRVQSRLYHTAMFSAENMLLCAPTGAGKTNVAMLAIMHEVGLHRQEDGSIDLSAFKIVYVAPMKALVQEVVANFTQRLTAAYGIVVRELSGDVNLTKAEIAETQIIVTTPEKWDVITRKAGDRTYTQLVRLIIIDEVHLLHDDRGPVLEAIVARTMRQVETTQEMVRIVGLSATLPNYEDVATFLRVDAERGLFHFDNSFRPCPLQQQYIGITEKKAVKRFQLMNDITYEKLSEQAGKNQVLIFVHSRKDTAKTAKALRDMAVEKEAISSFVRDDSASREILVTEAESSVKDDDLKELLPYGFAIHHAGMQRSDRTLVEELFADGHVQVLVSTATLAWGVNLPAHTVIIKGTQVYNPEKGRWTELSPLDMMQMLGRAGRPQFDTFGEGIIITGHGELQYYLSLLNQQLPIESQLVSRLADNLNAEIVSGSVTNVREGAAWLGYTYLYVRMLRNPTLYGVSAEDRERDPLLLQRRIDLIHTAALLLDKHSLVRYDAKTGAIQSTALGRVASHYYVSHATIATYNEYMKPTLGDIELFRLFSLSNEFRNVVIRQEEAEELRKLAERVPIPIKESLEEPSAKVNVLLQAYISNLKLDGFALMADMVYVHQSAGRLMRAIYEICLRRGWAALAQRALATAKMIDYRIWQSASPLRQFTVGQGGLNEDILRRLEKKEIPWERYYDLTPADLGELVRVPKLGKAIHRLIHALPRVELSAHVQPITRSLLRFDLTIAPDFVFDPKIHGANEMFWIMVEDADGETILHHETFVLKSRYGEEDHHVTFYVPLTEPLPPQYFVRVVADRWLHSETLLPVSLRSLILPEKFPPHTELLDLAPLPVTSLKNAAFEALYTSAGDALGAVGRLRTFNPIQTQTFPALYNSDAPVLVAAPSGSGKTVCAEFALLRLFSTRPDARAVYVAPRAETCRDRYDEWEYKFGRGLGKAVVELTGELAADLKLVERAHIVICTPRQWDVVSRRWKKRRAVAETALFIADELQTIGDDTMGPTYEVVVSRMRFIAMQSTPPTRIVALSMSVANARDVGDWIGAGPSGTFNFHPQVRPVPLEIRIQGFDVPHFGARMLAMSRPVYSACLLRVNSPDKSALVFAPSRKQSQLTAVDLITYAAADGKADVFRRGRIGEEQLQTALQRAGVRDSALTTCIMQGVGYYHEAMRPAEKTFVEDAYMNGWLGVVVATASSGWSMGGTKWGAHLVVIMGTEFYEGREHRYVDYPLTDVLHLMGRASRPGRDETGFCVILCAATRKEYLKKFLYEPLPVESFLHTSLHDAMNAEVVNRVVETKQDALDYLTWTFLYRRLPQNPNFYNLQGVTHRHLSDFMSELVDSTLGDLEASQCISITDEINLEPQSLGMIAAYYYIAYTTLEVFASSVGAKVKMKGLLEILSMATEYDTLPLRHGEEGVLRSMSKHAPLALPPPAEGRAASQFNDVHVKANLLLQAHFSRAAVSGELRGDQARAVEDAVTLVQALVDVISSEGWLKPALASMELSQMLVQAVWADKDSVLMQVPHMTRDLAAALEAGTNGAPPVETIFDLITMDDEVRARALGMPPAHLADVARFCNRYPNIDVGYSVSAGDAAVVSGEPVRVSVTLERERGTEGMQEGAGIGAVYAPFYPKPKAEGWWLVVGEASSNSILVLKRVTLADRSTVNLEFPAPSTAGAHKLTLYFMSDSYLGCDQEYGFQLNVEAGDADGEVPMEDV